MYDYFKNIANKNTCNSGGICSIHPSVNSLYEIILNEVSKCAFYVVKLKEFNLTDKSTIAFLVETMSIFLINTSFNKEKYLSLVLKLNSITKEIKEKYLSYCSSKNFPCETINDNFDITNKTTITKLIEYSEKTNVVRQKNFDKTKLNLFELITLMTKLSALNVVKIKKIDSSFDKYDFEILRFFALVNGYSIRVEKIKRRILEFSKIAVEIEQKLYSTYDTCYGKRQKAKVDLALKKGYNILVSGDDLNDLDNVLKAVSNRKEKEEINVYTNGSLFLAHFYPYFKNNKFLKGHYGTDSAEYDFSNFEGAILITQNFVQKIDSLYRGEIFSKKLISFAKVFDIENDNYNPLIETCLKTKKIENDEEKNIKEIDFKDNKFNNLKENEEVVLVVGKYNKIDAEKCNNKKVIFLNSPLENDLLLNKIDEFKKNNIKLSVFFSQCNLASLNLLFCLLDCNFELYFVNCSNVLINPHVLEALKEEFNVKLVD